MCTFELSLSLMSITIARLVTSLGHQRDEEFAESGQIF